MRHALLGAGGELLWSLVGCSSETKILKIESCYNFGLLDESLEGLHLLTSLCLLVYTGILELVDSKSGPPLVSTISKFSLFNVNEQRVAPSSTCLHNGSPSEEQLWHAERTKIFCALQSRLPTNCWVKTFAANHIQEPTGTDARTMTRRRLRLGQYRHEPSVAKLPTIFLYFSTNSRSYGQW